MVRPGNPKFFLSFREVLAMPLPKALVSFRNFSSIAIGYECRIIVCLFDRQDPQWEWSYLLINSAHVPGVGSVEVLGEEHLLAAAKSTATEAEEANVTQTLHPALPNQPQDSPLALASGFSTVLFCSCDRKGFPNLIRSWQGLFGLYFFL